MKKLNKKLLTIGLTVLIFSIFFGFLVYAQFEEQPFFRVNSASTTPANAKRAGDEAFIHVVNRSGKDYFVPNNTPEEFESFRNNAPNYVSVSVCGDGVCGEGETLLNCGDQDCISPQTKYVDYCGDGFCNQQVVCKGQATSQSFDKLSNCFRRLDRT